MRALPILDRGTYYPFFPIIMSSTAQRQQWAFYLIYSVMRSGWLHPRTNDNPELREKIVQVLSSTVNGCLSELGYYPGIGQQLHEALKANNHLQQANDKLFEDNRALARLAALQNDRLALVDGTEHSRLKTYTDMESMVKVLTAEKAELMKRNSLFVQSLPTSDVLKNLQASHNNLQREYLRLRESYNSLYKTSASHNIFPGKQVPWSNLLESSNSNCTFFGQLCWQKAWQIQTKFRGEIRIHIIKGYLNVRSQRMVWRPSRTSRRYLWPLNNAKHLPKDHMHSALHLDRNHMVHAQVQASSTLAGHRHGRH